MRLKKILLLIILFNAHYTFCQGVVDDELNAKYTPPTILTAGSTDDIYHSEYNFPNIVKFNPTLLTRGIISLQYEKLLFNNNISIGGGLGFFAYKDIFFQFDVSIYNDYRGNINLLDIVRDGEQIGGLTNYFFTSFIKISYDGIYFLDPYIEIGYRREKNNLRLNNSNRTPLDRNFYNTYFINNLFYAGLNYPFRTKGKKVNLNHEFYWSFAYRLTTYERFGLAINPSNAPNNRERYFNSNEIVSFNSFCFLIGYSIGLGFK